MSPSARLNYLVFSAICILNMVGMFLVVFGAAAGGHVALLFWPGIALLVGGVLLLTIFSATRASQVGVSPWTAAIATPLTCVVGPTVLFLIIYLAMKDEKSKSLTPVTAHPWLQWLFLLLMPWIILSAIQYASAGGQAFGST